MAALTVLAMLVFVLADTFDMSGRQGRSLEDPVVVETEYFSMNESDLDRAMAQRDLVLQFAERVVVLFLEQNELMRWQQQAPQLSIDQLRQIIGRQDFSQRAREIAVFRFGPLSETSVVETAVLAEKAKRMGIVASNEMIQDFIVQTFLGGAVPKEQLAAIFNGLARNRKGLTFEQLLAAYRPEMLSWAMKTLFAPEPAPTPLDRWNYYLRKRETAAAEVLPVRTKEDVIDKNLVGNPTNEQLAQFYEEFRFQEPVPGSPDPGFKIPQQAAFQYAAANEADFIDPAAITAEQIAAHYESNKEFYRYKAEDFSETESAAKPTEPTQVSPDGDAKPTDAKQPTDAKSEPETKGDATSNDGACGAESTDACGADEPAVDPSAAKTEAAAPAPVTAKSDAAPPPPTATGTAPSATLLTPPAPPTPSATPSGTALAAAPPPPLPPGPLPTEDWLLPDNVRSGRKPEYDPLWKVEDKIRDELARKAAVEKIEKLFEDLKDRMTAASGGRDLNSKGPVFSAEAWQQLVAEFPKLTAVTTPLMSGIEALEASDHPGFFRAQLGDRGDSVAVAEFGDSSVYVVRKAEESPQDVLADKDATNVRYLYWKYENVPSRVPPLDEIRDEVVFAWKTREARQKAREIAAELADRARQSNQTLAEQFPDRDVRKTGEFTWFETDLSGGLNPQVEVKGFTDVENVQDAGYEFMQTVFGLDVDGIGTAMNNPETICYVIRLTSISPPRDKLYDAFTVDQLQTYGQYGVRDVERYTRAEIDKLVAEADIKWLREPNDPISP